MLFLLDGISYIRLTVRSIWPKLCFKSNVSFFIFHLDHLSIAESGVLKSSTIVVLSSSLFRSLSICLIYLVHQCRVCMYLRLLSFWWIDHLSLYNDLSLHFSLKLYFFWHKYSYSCSLLVSTCMEYHFPSLHFQPMCGLKAVVSLLQAAYNWVFFFLIHPDTLCFLIGEFNLFTFNYWYLRTYYCHLIIFRLFCSSLVPLYTPAVFLCELVTFHCGKLWFPCLYLLWVSYRFFALWLPSDVYKIFYSCNNLFYVNI